MANNKPTINMTKEELIKLAHTMTIKEMADEFGTSYTTMWKLLKAAGYTRKVGRPKKINIQ